MKLYFARHGKMDATPSTPLSTVNGQVDEPLSPLGVQQAEELARKLKDVQFDAVIASPLKRAHQTADIVNTYHDLPLNVDGVWRERDTGGYVDVETWNNLFDVDLNVTSEKIEPLNDFLERIYEAIESLKQQYGDKTVLVVAHGGVHLAVYMYANKIPISDRLEGSPMENCEFRIYEL